MAERPNHAGRPDGITGALEASLRRENLAQAHVERRLNKRVNRMLGFPKGTTRTWSLFSGYDLPTSWHKFRWGDRGQMAITTVDAEDTLIIGATTSKNYYILPDAAFSIWPSISLHLLDHFPTLDERAEPGFPLPDHFKSPTFKNKATLGKLLMDKNGE